MSAPLRAEFEQRCAAMGSEADRAYYAVELFLGHYSAPLRRAHGIYYTPRAVVDYLVASVDNLLISQFGLSQGLTALADNPPALALVDPACGAGIFLANVLRRTNARLARSERAEFFRRVARQIAGYELVPAVAHAARWLLEHEFAGESAVDSGRRITDLSTIRPASALHPDSVLQMDEWRTDAAPLVIIGNPPYGSFGSANRHPWLLELLRDYQTDLGERKHNLHDNALKFLRWAQWHIDRAGRGILAFVLNHAFVHGLTHRRVRASLQESFEQLYLLDLHGSSLRQQSTLAARDENIFGIRPGVALLIGVKTGSQRPCRVAHCEMLGRRSTKLAELARTDVTTTPWTQVTSSGPAWNFVPQCGGSSDDDGYRRWPSLATIFRQYTSGVQTKNDALFTDTARQPLAGRIQQWLVHRGEAGAFDAGKILPYMMAPWDLRWIYYDPRLLGRARYAVLRHLERDNLALVFMRQNTNADYDHALATRVLVSDRVFYSGHGAPFVAPLYLYEGTSRADNFDAAWLAQLTEQAGAAHAEDAFAYLYAVLQAPAYRERYADYLNRDFPRIPLPPGPEFFHPLADLGRQLLAAHLSTWVPADENTDEPQWHVRPRYPKWNAEEKAVYINAECRIADVPSELWSFRLGGYPVLARWLTKRRGRAIDSAERAYFAWLCDTIRHTRALEATLNQACDRLLQALCASAPLREM